MTKPLMERIDSTATFLREQLETIPHIVVVAGSGLSQYARTLADSRSIPYTEIPNFPRSTVVGHAGELVWGRVASSQGPAVLVMNGRAHLYEGHDPETATLPLRSILRAGSSVVLLSNAAGGLNRLFTPGDIMLIADHVNFQFRNPLIGKNLDSLGPRFPDLSNAWDSGLRDVARRAALRVRVPLREGVYISGTGPTYETQAEVQMLRQWGDAVGMSTVPENLVAIHAGARCLGLSVITNSLVLRTDKVTTHEEVVETGRNVAAAFQRLVDAVILDLERGESE
jgi:purine-nucleoside phosphorylase